MRIPVLLILFAGLQACTPANNEPTKIYTRGDALEISGTLVDTRCFGEDDKNVGNDHDRPEGHIPGCGTACAQLGLPVAVLEGGSAEGKVWVLLTSPQAMADYISAPVKVSGTIRDNGILIPERIELKTTDGWTIIL